MGSARSVLFSFVLGAVLPRANAQHNPLQIADLLTNRTFAILRIVKAVGFVRIEKKRLSLRLRALTRQRRHAFGE